VNGLKSPVRRPDIRDVGNYDEMSTARLTWVVLDRLVPSDEVSDARAALIARDPELQSLVAQGVMSETEAVEALRSRQGGRPSPSRRMTPAVFLLILFVAWLVVRLVS